MSLKHSDPQTNPLRLAARSGKGSVRAVLPGPARAGLCLWAGVPAAPRPALPGLALPGPAVRASVERLRARWVLPAPLVSLGGTDGAVSMAVTGFVLLIWRAVRAFAVGVCGRARRRQWNSFDCTAGEATAGESSQSAHNYSLPLVSLSLSVPLPCTGRKRSLTGILKQLA